MLLFCTATITSPRRWSMSKLALSNIVEGERIYKYGYVIGLAQMDIKAGHCVHVHNMSSLV
jgi:hypothetical protein